MNITDKLTEIKNIFKSVSIVDLIYQIEKLEKCKSEFFKRCAPCDEGDRVAIIKDLKIPKESGWYGCKHFLIVGAKGRVEKVDFLNGQFRVDVVFDYESWVDSQGNETEIEDKHTFCMNEKAIKKLNT